MRKKTFWALLAALSLAALLALLLLAEAPAPGATIVTVPSALWYLLTTLTTVGYGDCYPVTTAGRIIGVVFQLMSLGVLGMLFGVLISMLRGQAWEAIKLSRLRGKTWYIFSEENAASEALAASLAGEDAERVLLFAQASGASPVGRVSGLSAEELCQRKKDGDFLLFCISERETENERLAARVKNGRVYCRSFSLPDRLPDNQQRFDPTELCARLYWDRFPLRSAVETVMLLGDGPWAEAIFEQGLLRNVVDPAQHVHYICAGDWASFLRRHPQLSQALELNSNMGGRDILTVLEHWDDDAELLRTADRIVLCFREEGQTRLVLEQLRRCFAVSGAVHARLSFPTEGAACFGSPEELYTPALVLREALSQRAMAVNARYRASNPDAASWRDLSDFARRSNLAAADHLSVKLRLLGQEEDSRAACVAAYKRYQAAGGEERDRFRRIEHARWCRFHLLNGWQYGPARDNNRRLHPMLVPFDKLSLADQEKDDYSWEVLFAEE